MIPVVKRLGHVDYAPTFQAMQDFTATRTAVTPDELWIVEHPPVYTVGLAGKAEHYPRGESAIPVVRTDRGGQITYHGPGQIVAYTLVDLRRPRWGVRDYVRRLESAMIELLGAHGVEAYGKVDAPGVYVRTGDAEAKIGALGLKVRNGCTYHGVALNVAMDLEPYSRINPCGYAGLKTVDLSTIGVQASWQEVADLLGRKLAAYLSP